MQRDRAKDTSRIARLDAFFPKWRISGKHIEEEAVWCAKFDKFKVLVNKLVVRMYPFLYECVDHHSECVDRYSLQINYLSVVCKRLMDAAPIILISRQLVQ